MRRPWLRSTLAVLAALALAGRTPAQDLPATQPPASTPTAPSLEHGGAANFDPADFSTDPSPPQPLVAVPAPQGPQLPEGPRYAGPGFGPRPESSRGTGTPSQGAPYYGGAPRGNEFPVVTAGDRRMSVHFMQGDQRFVFPPKDGRVFTPVDLPAFPSGSSHSCLEGNCFGHNTRSAIELRNSKPGELPLAYRTLDDPQAALDFQRRAAADHQLQDKIPPSWTVDGKYRDREDLRWKYASQEIAKHPNHMGQVGVFFQDPSNPDKDIGHVFPTRGLPQRVYFRDDQGRVVRDDQGQRVTGEFLGAFNNTWFPVDPKTRRPNVHDGFGVVRIDGPEGKAGPGYMFTYNPNDPVARASAEKFQDGWDVVPGQRVYLTPEFSASDEFRQLFESQRPVPAERARYDTGLPGIGVPGMRRGRGVRLQDSTD